MKEFHQYLTNAEKYLTALRIVESNLQKEFKTRQPTINLSVSPIDFRIDDEENDSQFFKYPIGTKMIDVWAESNSIPFKMDLIKEDGKLKIVAIYPPID